MLTPEKAKEVIKLTVKTSILSFAKRNLLKVADFQILDLIIPKERKIRSVVGGLETSLGTTLWEPLAKALASQNGFEVITDKLECPSNMPSILNSTLQNIIGERKQGTPGYNAQTSHQEIKKVCQIFKIRKIDSFVKAPRGRGVDIWLRKDGVNYFFDTKTVQPNLSALVACMEEVLTWYAYFYSRYPTESAEARIVFPYNPYNKDFWLKVIGKGFPLERDTEAWVGNQFWDFCSGLTDTFNIIQEAFQEIRESKDLEKDFENIFS